MPISILAIDSDKTIREVLADSEGKLLIGAKTTVITLTLSLDTNIYAAGDVLAAVQEVASVVPIAGGTATLQDVVLLDQDDQGQPLDLFLLNATGSFGAENAAAAPTDAVAATIVAAVEIAAADYIDLANSQIAIRSNLGIVCKCTSAATSLFLVAITRGTPTHTASGIVVQLAFLQD